MQITWLDILAGNIGGAAFVAMFIFLWTDWRKTGEGFAAFCAWLVFVMGMGLFVWRAGCWADKWTCS